MCVCVCVPSPYFHSDFGLEVRIEIETGYEASVHVCVCVTVVDGVLHDGMYACMRPFFVDATGVYVCTCTMLYVCFTNDS